MPGYLHDHDEDGFEPGCAGCELAEVSLQDTGRTSALRITTGQINTLGGN